MNALDRIALRAAEQARRTLGARIGLSALRGVALQLSDARARAEALLGAAECAAELGDEPALVALLALWGEAQGPDVTARVSKLAAALQRAHRWPLAAALGEAEHRRRNDATSAYFLGRTLEAADPARAERVFHDAEALAMRPPRRPQVARAARHRRVALRVRSGDPIETEPATLERAPDASWRPWERFSTAAAAASTGGRYRRAQALDDLAEVVAGDDPHLAAAAARVAARAIDRRGESLTEIERDRAASLFARLPDELARRRTKAALDERRDWAPEPAAAVVRAHLAGERVAIDESALGSLDGIAAAALACAASIAEGAFASAVEQLRTLALDVASAGPVRAAPMVWATAWQGALSNDEEVAREGARLVDALVRHATTVPSVGLVTLGDALHLRHRQVAERCYVRAARWGESGSDERAQQVWLEEAWDAWEVGDHEKARELLHRAGASSG